MAGGEVENAKIIPGVSANEQKDVVPQRGAAPPRREAAGFHALAFIAWGVAVYAVLKHGRYRAELLAGVLVLLALTTLFNLVYLLYARLLRVPVEEFAVGLGGGFGKFRIGRTLVRFGWMPQGGYVKFPGQHPLDAEDRSFLRPGERTYLEVPPLARVPFLLSAPAALLALGLALQWVAGDPHLWGDIRAALSDIPGNGPIALARRAGDAWLRSFSGPGGMLRGTAVTAIFFGALNLFPAPIVSGGAALAALVESFTSRRFAEKWVVRGTMLLAIPVVLFMFGWFVGVVLAVFGRR